MGMSWNRVIGQERVVHSLKQALVSGRVAHAYIFHGPEGVGKRAAAFALAAALQCEDGHDGSACGACSACNKVSKGIHPDVHVMMPVTNDDSKKAQKDVADRLRLLAEDPYATVDLQKRPSLDGSVKYTNKQINYTIKQVHTALLREMSFHKVEGRYRIAIVLDADLMRREGANAFLKLLEEPGKNTVFILTTNRIDHMMGTILSRCQQLRFESLTIEEIAKGLAARGLGDSLTIDTVARKADGSLSKAIELASSDDLPAVREQVLAFLRTSYAGNGMDTVAMVDQISRLGRENVKFQLQVMIGILRDLFLLRVSGNTDLIVNIDQLETLTKFAANLSEARLEDMIEAVERTAYLIERNVNLRLLLIALSRLLSSAMRGVRTAGMDINLLEA